MRQAFILAMNVIFWQVPYSEEASGNLPSWRLLIRSSNRTMKEPVSGAKEKWCFLQ
jgi:hypothetical protein